MHFEILIEDASGKIMLESVIGKILGSYGQPHTWKIIAYKGIGRLPKNLKGIYLIMKVMILINLIS